MALVKRLQGVHAIDSLVVAYFQTLDTLWRAQPSALHYRTLVCCHAFCS